MRENQISRLTRMMETIETPQQILAQIDRFIQYITPLSRYQVDLEYSERPMIKNGLNLLQRVAHCYNTDKELMNSVSKAYDIYHSKFGIRTVREGQ